MAETSLINDILDIFRTPKPKRQMRKIKINKLRKEAIKNLPKVSYIPQYEQKGHTCEYPPLLVHLYSKGKRSHKYCIYEPKATKVGSLAWVKTVKA